MNALAVLETTDALLHSLAMNTDTKALHIARLAQARAAVAELIEAASALPRDPANACTADFQRLRAALAKVQA